MRFALIDNSTLTGVQRLLGDIPVGGPLVSDMDIACLETLVQAILFYDQIVVLDDYKEEWQQQRKEKFPYLHFLSVPPDKNQAILEQVKEEVAGIVPRVSAGQFTDKDFEPFFKLLRMNVIFTWDLQSSEFFLTQKMLAGVGGVDFEKYGQLADAIYFELSDRREAETPKLEQKKIELVGSDGAPIDPSGSADSYQKGLSRQASAFFAGLNWLAFRTIYFSLLATWLQADLLLHPIRHAFHLTWMTKTKMPNPSRYKPLVDAMSDKAGGAITTITRSSQPAVECSQMPLMSAWILQKTGDPAAILQAALDLRTEPKVAAARRAFIELDGLAETAPHLYVKQANRVLKNLDDALEAVKASFSVSTAQGNITTKLIKVVNFGMAFTGWNLPALPDDILKLRMVDAFSARLQGRYVSPLYRSVVNDLASIARLGDLNERLKSRVARSQRAGPSRPKVEEVKFRRVRSHWKHPM